MPVARTQIWSNCRLFNDPDDEVSEACRDLEKIFNRQWEKEGLKGLARREAEEARRVEKEKEKKQQQKDRAREKKQQQRDRERGRKREQKERERERARQKKVRERERENERNHSRRDRERKASEATKTLSPQAPTPTPKKTSPKHLRLALKVVKDLSRQEFAEAFLEPVDAEALDIPEYHKVIKEPMDLGTVRETLEAGPTVGWDNLDLKTLSDVHAAVTRIWSNCLTFNSGEGDTWIRQACAKSAGFFEEKWKAAGLLELEKAERGEVPAAGEKGGRAKRRLSDGGGGDTGGGGDRGGRRKRAKKGGDKKAAPPTPEQAAFIAAINAFTQDVVGRCPICKVQKKGQCGTETAPLRCLRRKAKGLRYVPALDEDGNLISQAARMAEAREIRLKEEAARKAEQARLQAAAVAAEKEAHRREKLLNKQRERDQTASGLRAQADQANKDLKDMEVALAALAERQTLDLESDEAMWAEREAAAKKVSTDYTPEPLRLPSHVLELGAFFLAPGFNVTGSGTLAAGPSSTDEIAQKALQAAWGGKSGVEDISLVRPEEVQAAARNYMKKGGRSAPQPQGATGGAHGRPGCPVPMW